MDKKYRLYIDETGTAAYKEQESERYLTLTGVIMKDTEIIRLKILLDDFKYTYIPNYDTDSGELFNLHRTDMVNCKGCFSFLKNESLRTQFDDALLSLLNNMDFTIISATFDKIAISRKYGIFRKHPYTYLLDILFTRYIYFLDNENARGDILIEPNHSLEEYYYFFADQLLNEKFSKILGVNNAHEFTFYYANKKYALYDDKNLLNKSWISPSNITDAISFTETLSNKKDEA